MEVFKFLEPFKSRDNNDWTHTSLSPRGKYNINYLYIDKFMNIYSKCIFNLKDKDLRPTITERPGFYTPLRIDIDMQYISSDKSRLYTHTIVKDIIKLYQTELQNIIITDDNSIFSCILLEKLNPRVQMTDDNKNYQMKDGFHLHFPFIVTESWLFEFLRVKITSRIKSKGILNTISDNLSTPIDKLIDSNIGTKTWIMYGGAKDEKSLAYLYSKSYDFELNELSLDDLFSEEIEDMKGDVLFYLPKLLSIKDKKQSEIKKEFIDKYKHIYYRTNIPIIIKRVRSEKDILTDLKIIQDGNLMDMISPDRADNYSDWIDIGWILFNITEGREEGYNLWLKFSSTSNKFNEKDCENLWSKMTCKGKTIASIYRLAKFDNPEEYGLWRKRNINYWITESLKSTKPNEYDISVVFKFIFEGMYIYASDKKSSSWYEFKNHRWIRLDDEIFLRKKIVEDLYNEYVKYDSELNQQILDKTTNNNTNIEWEEKSKKQCFVVRDKLKRNEFQSKIISQCKIHFADSSFKKKLNSNTHVVGCSNGVYDLLLNKFRDGRQDDFISYSTGIEYKKPTKEELKQLKDYLQKILPNKKRRKYFLIIIAACFGGENTHKKFIIATGPRGDNGKTKCFSLLELVFGDYMIKIPRELLIKGNLTSSSNARPELMRMSGKRLVAFQELTKDDEFNIGVLKELTGSDSIWARNLHDSDGETIIPQFTVFMQCNDPPKIPKGDEATWNRIRNILFESIFNNRAPKDKNEQILKNHYPVDRHINKKLPSLAGTFLWYLLKIYIQSKDKELVEPKEVLDITNEYKSRNDIYLQYFNERIEKDKESSITLTELVSDFNEWYKSNYPGYYKDKPGKNELRDYMTKYMGSISKHKWINYKFVLLTENNIDIPV